MTLEELKKKYGTDSINLMINRLMIAVPLSPHAYKIYEELKRDLKSVLNSIP
jgi:hypothetical protein